MEEKESKKKCRIKYVGETYRSLYDRAAEHLEDLKNMDMEKEDVNYGIRLRK